MEALMAILPVILYILAIVVLVIFIVLGIKLIYTVDKANVVLDDIGRKSKSLNGFFNVIDVLTDTLSYFSDNVVNGIVSGITKIFTGSKSKNTKKKKENDFDE